MRPTRRVVLTSGTAGIVGSLLAACSGSEDSSSAEAENSPGSSGSSGGAGGAEGSFPVTVAHKFGETTIEKAPTRVVSVGVTEQDTLLQLGVVPVAITEWYGDQPYATWPWAQELLGDAEPTVLNTDNGFQYEKIAALAPDLIVGVNAGMEEKDYKLLSAIAPTVSSVEGSSQYFSPWQDQALQIARALGREADGQALIDDVLARYSAAEKDHPEWKGKTATFSQGEAYSGVFYVYQDGLSTDFLTNLGFTITPGLEKYSPAAGNQAEISVENVNLLDADVIVWATEDEKMLENLLGTAGVSDLGAVAEDRSVYTQGTLAAAIYFDTPLSHGYVIDHLIEPLELASQGKSPQTLAG